MSAGGYYQMARGWMESDAFAAEPYTEREAWVWLIENATWKDGRARIKGETVDLERGQLCFAQRFMAEKWQWSKSRVDRFLKRLVTQNMISICSKIGATAGQGSGQGQSIITICNYAKYQSPKDQERGNDESEIGATAGQQRGKEEEGNKGKKKEYFFTGRTIRLSRSDFEAWQSAYSAIPDLAAELQALDDWMETLGESERKGWYHRTSGALKNKNAEYRTRPREPVIGL